MEIFQLCNSQLGSSSFHNRHGAHYLWESGWHHNKNSKWQHLLDFQPELDGAFWSGPDSHDGGAGTGSHEVGTTVVRRTDVQ